MKKNIKKLLVRGLALSVVFSMAATSAFAAKVEAKQICEIEAHQHKEERKLICGKEAAEGHTHGDGCYAWSYELTCTEVESENVHSHSEENGCYKTIKVLNCQDAHHTEACYTSELTCTETGHTHGDGCYSVTEELACTETAEDHIHDSACYNVVENLTCTQAEGEHTHSDGCYTSELTCTEEHHTDSCYEERTELICTESDLPVHKHTEDCYTRGERGELLCALEERESHEHTDVCYETTEVKSVTCGKEEHTHTASCYSNEDVATGLKLEDALKAALDGDGDVVLILNGQVLKYSEGGNAITVNGKDLTIQDEIGGGGIQAGPTGNQTIRIIKVVNGTVNLEGGKISGGNGNGGGAVYIGEGGSLNMSGGEISGNHSQSNGGAVLVDKDGTFNMSGGTISNNTAANDGGGVAVMDGTFNMSGGTISNNETNADTWTNSKYPEPEGQGGGVYVGNKGEFELSGGTISGNTAGEGGGIFVDRGVNTYEGIGSFNMTGGTVDGNSAMLGEGGGIYIQGEGEISGGKITNNVTYTYKDLGGGGIYIESDGTLKLTNAIITANTANGLGGGIAACVHGKTIVYAEKGAAIFGNSADGKGHSAGYGGNGQSATDGYILWAGNDVLKNCAQDIFTAGDATAVNSQGTAGVIVGNTMLGDGQANWTGWTYCYVVDENGKPVNFGTPEAPEYAFELTEVTESNNGTVFGNRLMFMTANPDKESIDKALESVTNQGVIISGNLSANSHGGGIANNGMLTIGEAGGSNMNSYRPETELEKNLESNNEDVTIADKTFTFEVVDKDQKVIGTMQNDEQGNAKFDFPPELFNDVEFGDGEVEKTYTFYVREQNDNQANVTYDSSLYRVTFKIVKTVEKVTIGNEVVEVETLTVGEPVIEILSEDGTTYVPVDGIEFNNKYTEPPVETTTPPVETTTPPVETTTPPVETTTPPVETTTPPVETTRPPEPTPVVPEPTPVVPETPVIPEVPETPEIPEPPVTPEEPEEIFPDVPQVDIPNLEVPLADIPEEADIPDSDVPLADIPDADVPLVDIPEGDVPLADIPDGDVPLADVPKTGDNSLIWALTTLFSGLGLFWLMLDKKRKEDAE